MKKLILFLILILAVFLSPSCQKDDAVEVSATQITVKIYDQNNTLLKGIKVGISASSADCTSSSYLVTKLTDSDGKAVFGNLNGASTYFITIINTDGTHNAAADCNSVTTVKDTNTDKLFKLTI